MVRHSVTTEVKLVMIFIDPWKDIDFSTDQPFDVPENVFVVKNSSIFLPKSIDLINMFSDDKIKAVSILPASNLKGNCTLIVQYWHSIYLVSISGCSTRRLTEPNEMVREYMVQGQNNRLFYAERKLDRDDICMLYLGKKSSKAKKRKIFELEC